MGRRASGDRSGGSTDRARRLPGQLDEGPARGGVGLVEIGDVGEADEDRVAPPDVGRLLARAGMRESEEDGIPDGERVAGGQSHDRPATPASLDFRDPLFVGRVGVHSRPPIGDASLHTGRLCLDLHQGMNERVAGAESGRGEGRPVGDGPSRTARWRDRRPAWPINSVRRPRRHSRRVRRHRRRHSRRRRRGGPRGAWPR